MLTAVRTSFKAASSAGLLPAFGWALLAGAVLSAGAAGWAVHRWDKGAQAIAEASRLKAEHRADVAAYNKLVKAATQREQQRVDDDLARKQSLDRMDAIADKLEQDHEANRRFTETQRADLAALLDRRPDLRGLRLGDDVLQHWNASNAGAAASGAAGAASAPAGKPAPAVPAAPASGERPPSRPAGQPRPGGGAVSGLQRQHRQPAGGLRRVASHGVELVLQRGGSSRPRRVGVPA